MIKFSLTFSGKIHSIYDHFPFIKFQIDIRFWTSKNDQYLIKEIINKHIIN